MRVSKNDYTKVLVSLAYDSRTSRFQDLTSATTNNQHVLITTSRMIDFAIRRAEKVLKRVNDTIEMEKVAFKLLCSCICVAQCITACLMFHYSEYRTILLCCTTPTLYSILLSCYILMEWFTIPTTHRNAMNELVDILQLENASEFVPRGLFCDIDYSERSSDTTSFLVCKFG